MTSHILELLTISNLFIRKYLKANDVVHFAGEEISASNISDQIRGLKTDSTYPYGTDIENQNDGFQGKVIGNYVTLENERGVVVQQYGTKVVHVYREKWVNPIEINKTQNHLEVDYPGII